MLQPRRTDKPYGINFWLSLAEAELGHQVLQHYEDVSNAKLLVLAPEYINVTLDIPSWMLERQDQEELYLGFAEESLSSHPRLVKGWI